MSTETVSAWRSRSALWLLPVAVLLVVGLVLVEPLRRSDLMVFLRAAGDVVHGANPYTPTDDPFLWGGSAYVYPYLTAFLFVPLTWLPVPVADVLWFLASGGAVVVGCRLLGAREPVAVSAVLVSATCIRSLQVGSLNALLFLAAAVLWRYRDRTLAVAGALVLLAGSKLFLLPVALWVLITRPRRTVLVAGAALGGFLGLSLLLQPISVGQFVDSMNLLALHEGPGSMSFQRWAAPVLPHAVGRLLPLFVGACLVAAGAVFRSRHREAGDAVLLAACILASLVATPIYWSHYTVLVAVVVLLAHPTRRAAVLFAVATWLVARPVRVPTTLQLPLSARLLLLYAGMAAALLVLARRVRTPVSPVEPP